MENAASVAGTVVVVLVVDEVVDVVGGVVGGVDDGETTVVMITVDSPDTDGGVVDDDPHAASTMRPMETTVHCQRACRIRGRFR